MADDNGLEAMYQLHKGALSGPNDAALLFVHWVLVQSGFRVQVEEASVSSNTAAVTSDTPAVTSDTAAVTSDTAAVTSDTAAVTSDTAAVTSDTPTVTSDTAAVTSDTPAVTSELLPDGWAGQQVCSLQYIAGADSATYLLKALTVGAQLVVNMMKQTAGSDEGHVRTFNVVVSDLVVGNIDRYRGLYCRPGHFRKQVEECLLRDPSDPVSSSSGSSSTTTTTTPSSGSSTSSQSRDPLRIPSSSSRRQPLVGDPLAVGGADLDPFGGGFGGGMLMDPRGFRPSRTPSWLPPGARYDPFNPSGLRPRPPGQFPGEPDYDHMRPPDHFM